ncbi:MAG: SRPBCC family protein [Myxococcales bacterium]|nr:SRPBCC family protein [Myxococcales bacterium]USN50733.1 MAG: SRPBCC family protein [Myxococcales bacterium]
MHIIEYRQNISVSLHDCWEFFSAPQNLKILTPPHLGFSDKNDAQPMYPGQIIIHQIKPLLGIPIEWVTQITHVKIFDYFIDEQRFGPYKFWHHEHRFQESSDGTRIIDRIHYQLPFGPLGNLMNWLKVRRDLEKIFDYRQQKIVQIFK